MEEQSQFPGVTAQAQGVVTYPMPHGANPAQVLGYLQPATTEQLKKDHLPAGTGYSTADLVGQAGLEEQYNRALTGTTGTDTVSVNAAGDVTGTVGGTAAKPGDTLVTSINSKIQADAQNALNSAIGKARAAGNNANQGAAVVMTTTGRVVAMASYPDYNPNVWTNGISQSQFDALFGQSDGAPAINWTTQGQYAPGSTWKVTSTAAAVSDGFSLDGQYSCPASVNIGGHTYKNDGEPSQGDMSFAEALIQSCDTVYYNLAYEMWQRDNPRANVVTSAKRPGAEDAAGGAGVGLRQVHRDRPARGGHRHGADPRVAVLLLEGQRPHRARTGASTARLAAPTSSRSSTRTARAATCGSRVRRPSPPSARVTTWPPRSS